MDQEDSWYTLIPDMVHQDKLAKLGLQDINPLASLSSTGSQDAEMYTPNELRGFWESIHINADSRRALMKNW